MAKKILIECKSCGEQIAKSAKTCPKCGAKNKKPFYKAVWFWVLIIIVVFGTIGAGGSSSSSSSSDSKGNVESQKKDKFEVVGGVDGITVEKDSFAIYFSGTIQNNTNKDYSYVQIEISLYDEDGALLGTALDNVNNLEANGKWKFKAMGLVDDISEVSSYKITDITGF